MSFVDRMPKDIFSPPY